MNEATLREEIERVIPIMGKIYNEDIDKLIYLINDREKAAYEAGRESTMGPG